MIVAVVGWKGGVGKTTVAMALAAGAGGELVDADHQGSALLWRQLAGDGVPPVAPGYVAQRRISYRVPSSMVGKPRELLVIDTPPGHPEVTQAALVDADVAVCPIRPALADLSRLWPVLEAARAAGTPALVVLNQTRARARSVEAVRAALGSQGVQVARTQFPLREAFSAAFGAPLPAQLVELGAELLKEIRRVDRRARRGQA